MWRRIPVVLFAAAICSGPVAVANDPGTPVGRLVAHGTIEVSPAEGQTIILSGDEYAYFGNELVRARKGGIAVLILGNEGAVYLAGESAMRVRPEEGRTTVQLEQGGIRFQFSKGQDFRIVAGGVEIGPEVLQRVASENATKVSGVVVLDGGETLVHTLSGGLKVSSGSAAAPHSVRVGQTFAFDVSKGSFIRVVRPQGQPTEEDDDDHRLIWWLVGGAALLYLVDQADGEEKSIVR